MYDEALLCRRRVLRAMVATGYIMKEEKVPRKLSAPSGDVLDGHIYVSEEVMTANANAKAPSKPTAKAEKRSLDELTDLEPQRPGIAGSRPEQRGDRQQAGNQGKGRCGTQLRNAEEIKT